MDESSRIATITLSRPKYLNAIDSHMPSEISRAGKNIQDKISIQDKVEGDHLIFKLFSVTLAEMDDRVHVIVVTGEGHSFCSGYDLIEFAQTKGSNAGEGFVLIVFI